MSILKKPYEISLWEDVLTFVYEDGFESFGEIVSEHGAVINQYYDERKICIIGSDTMNTPIRAVEGKLVSEINGTVTLTFKIYSHYYEEETDQLQNNPFTKLLTNERKIKLRYGAPDDLDVKWYDLIIKKIEEDSEDKTYSYTAKSLFINELSKSGFNLEFNIELENNTGTVWELGEYILEGTDWKIDKESTELLRQTIEEPVYKIITNKEIEAADMITDEKVTIPSGSVIYAFYDSVINSSSYFQLLWRPEYTSDPFSDGVAADDDNVIISESNLYIEKTNQENWPDFFDRDSAIISEKYRGRRLVRKIESAYDASIDKYVNIYKDDSDKDVYGFTETTYNSPVIVRDYVTNGSNFTSDAGWKVGGVIEDDSTLYPSLLVTTVPHVKDVERNELISNPEILKPYLKFAFEKEGQCLYNSGIVDHRQHINGFVVGENYIFRISYGKAGAIKDNGPSTIEASDIPLKIVICKYTLSNGQYILSENEAEKYFEVDILGNQEGYVEIQATCLNSLKYNEMIEMSSTLGLFIIPQANSGEIFVESLQFFKEVLVEKKAGEEGSEETTLEPLLPDEIWTDAQIVNTYYYYYPNINYTSIDDVPFLYKGSTPSTDFKESYSKSFEKKRSIEASESNRFNLLQDLCEIFECWVRFDIEHDADGKISLDENYRQKKWVSFHEFIGQENYSGFKYGINLKSIKRDIDSEEIVSKVIVKNNSNEFGKDGFCSIARAAENPNGENFILDFSYYVQQGLLKNAEIINDLYSEINGYMGYYKHLKRINQLRDAYIEEQSILLTDLSEYKANHTTYFNLLAEAEEELSSKKRQIKNTTGFTFEELLTSSDSALEEKTEEDIKKESWLNNMEIIRLLTAVGQLTGIIAKYKIQLESAEGNLNGAQERFDILQQELDNMVEEKEELNQRFYQKYSRFLQEGSWISEDYIDDNLYYLDAYSTARTSAHPQITYKISVLELSQIEGYENFNFSLGDKTTIEDTEFFGWTWKDGIQSPYREEIVVTELTINLDSPEENEIKVQNYKTQFEELFQRMAATTQSIEYSTGEYNKTAQIVEPNGTINFNVLQNSFANNAFILENSNDQSVIWDESGITTHNIKNPAEIVRLVSGGLFLTTDGGYTWNTGITGRGINANYITAGQIDANKIHILNGNFPSFRWDGEGLSAFNFSFNEDTDSVTGFNYNKFVRFDQYGLYGINGDSEFNPNIGDIKGEDKIWKEAQFALTWRGFKLRNDDGSVDISSNEDIRVLSGEKERVKIGRIENGVYGIRISNGDGKPVLETNDLGELWLKNELRVGDSEDSTVKIGYLDATRGSTNVHEVIHAGNNDSSFIVYEDGKLYAQGVEIEGEIQATGGTIGGLTIDQWKEKGYEVLIISDSGNIFKDDGSGQVQSKTLTASLYFGTEEIVSELTYQWQKNGVNISGATNKTLVVSMEELGETESATYGCVISYNAAN